MINIKTIEYTKNPVNTGEAFIIRVAVEEVLATWSDVKSLSWSETKEKTWEDIKLKIF